MANYNDTKMVIDAKIRRNGRQAITGDILNSVLTKMLDELGKGGFKFGGVVTPESSFTPGDANTAFIAAVPGVYTDFGGFTLEAGKLGVFTYDGSWHLNAIAVGGGGSAEGAVRFDLVQALTDAQKGVARGNIGAISSQQMVDAILVEVHRAQEAEERLRGNIQEEMDRAMQAESDLSNNILAEQTRAENAESAISKRIDTIIQGRNVRDIVGNYDELLAYDTSTLGDNDIVMVLLDATKSGHTTYYRWKEAESEWEFIGGLAFTYTKTEIDDKFAALHIVLPTIPTDAVEHPEDYQELLAQVDSVVRSAGSDASFKMPVLVVDGISGNVDVTFVKSNPAHLYLGIFADDMSTLYHITRTISTPRTYTLQIVEKVFVTETQATTLANDAIADALDEEAQGAIIEAIKAHHDTTKQDKDLMQSVITESPTNYPSSKAVVDYAAKKSEVGNLTQLQTTDKSSIVNAINEIKQSGGGIGEYKLLHRHDFSEDATSSSYEILTADDGTPIHQYKDILIFAQLSYVEGGSPMNIYINTSQWPRGMIGTIVNREYTTAYIFKLKVDGMNTTLYSENHTNAFTNAQYNDGKQGLNLFGMQFPSQIAYDRLTLNFPFKAGNKIYVYGR